MFNGDKLVALKHPPPERQELETLFSVVRREALRLRGDNQLGNVPRAVQEAINDYAEALPEDYDSLDQVRLGTEGKLLVAKYEADRETIRRETEAQAGMIEALLIAHNDLIERLPDWREFVAEIAEEPELTDADIPMVEQALDDIIAEWRADPITVDPVLPETLASYRNGLRVVKERAHAALMGLRDAIFAIIRYGRDYVAEVGMDGLEGAKPGIKKVISASMVGGLIYLSSKLPWWGTALQKGLEFLKFVGLL